MPLANTNARIKNIFSNCSNVALRKFRVAENGHRDLFSIVWLHLLKTTSTFSRRIRAFCADSFSNQAFGNLPHFFDKQDNVVGTHNLDCSLLRVSSRSSRESSTRELIRFRKGVERTASAKTKDRTGLRGVRRNDHRPFSPNLRRANRSSTIVDPERSERASGANGANERAERASERVRGANERLSIYYMGTCSIRLLITSESS